MQRDDGGALQQRHADTIDRMYEVAGLNLKTATEVPRSIRLCDRHLRFIRPISMPCSAGQPRKWPIASPARACRRFTRRCSRARSPADIRRAVEVEERTTFVNSRDPICDIVRYAQLRGWVSPQVQRARQDAHAEQRRDEQRRQAAEEQREQNAIDERMRKLSLRVQYGSLSDLSREDRRFYLTHTKNPGIAQFL
jgi:hypothetical protein